MGTDEDFRERSYDRHARHYAKESADEDSDNLLDDDTVDAWRHRRMYELIDPVLEADPDARWLTIGDGRYGKEAQYVLDHDVDALPTDISTNLLAVAKERGLIPSYREENAESLSFDDDSFDYVLCKESYHHFPRPSIALYEMLRVARKGVVLIEPNDSWINPQLVRWTVQRLGRLRDPDDPPGRFEYEESGNYKYAISRREIEKVAPGLDYEAVAFQGINDAYVSGVEDEQMDSDGPLQRTVRQRIRLKNALCRLGILDYSLLAAAIFIEPVSYDLRADLRSVGYDVVDLPDNPYLTAHSMYPSSRRFCSTASS